MMITTLSLYLCVFDADAYSYWFKRQIDGRNILYYMPRKVNIKMTSRPVAQMSESEKEKKVQQKSLLMLK